MRISELMTKHTACCKPSDSLAAAASVLWNNDCGCAPVIDDAKQVRGMITDRDICMAGMLTGRRLQDIRVGEVMAKDVAFVTPMESPRDAELVMRERRIGRLPVVDQALRVVGMVCLNDLVRWADDGGAGGPTPKEVFHLVRTIAEVGRPRSAPPASVDEGADEPALPLSAPTVVPGANAGVTVPTAAPRRSSRQDEAAVVG